MAHATDLVDAATIEREAERPLAVLTTTQGRAMRRAVPTRYRWKRINGIKAISTTGSSSTSNSGLDHPYNT